MEIDLSERAQHLLKVLIESYIREGQPVGSRMLARDSGLELSAATIRNVMADLEELGLVSSPHTSAGRVPTAAGYRVFVDTLLTVQSLDRAQILRLKRRLRNGGSVKELAESVSGLLSGITSMAGLVMLPRRESLTVRHIEFLPLSEGRVLAILVVQEREVRNCIIRTDRSLSVAELQQAANYLNATFVGKDLAQMYRQLLAELRDTRHRMDRLMRVAIAMAEEMCETRTAGDDFVMAGQTNLMEFEELASIERLRELFEAFNEKRQILHLLDQCMHAPGVQIFIGGESGYRGLDKCSLVTSSYDVDGKVLGVVGVIGPTRMDYERVIPLVDVTARLVSAALNQA